MAEKVAELCGKPVPKKLESMIYEIRDRVRELQKTYGNLSFWGRPFLFSREEVALLVYLNEKLGVSLDRLAKVMFVDKTALYKIVRRVREQSLASYYDQQENAVKQIAITVEDCLAIIEELLEARAKERTVDVFSSKIIQDFMSKPIRKRAVIAGKSAFLSEEFKKEALSHVAEIMSYMNRHNIMPSNPDMWSEEQVLQVLDKMLEDGEITISKRRKMMLSLRRIPQWNNWFSGLIGAVTKHITPVERVIFYKDYLKLKELMQQGELAENEFLTVALHIATSAREGYSRVKPSTNLDECQSSLVGLKWENITWRGELVEDSITIKIYESKTNKWWYCDPSWLDIDIAKMLRERARESGSIVKDLSGCKTVQEFVTWYRALLRKISKLLKLPWKLQPHDLRRSGLSIKAELGIPLELAVSDKMPLGVGWEDLKTAYIFYLRFSKHTKERLLRLLESAKQEIATP